MAGWKGKLFVVDAGDKFLIGITMPLGGPWTKVAIYDGEGPSPPTGFPKPVETTDPAGWLKEKAEKGFTFSAGTL